MNDDFINIEEYGHLKIEKVFFEIEYPILFTCVNENKDLFICVCCQSNYKGRKWLISKTSSLEIIKLLNNKITIRQIFIENPECRITIEEYLGKKSIKFNDVQDWSEDSIFLPKEGEYLDADPGEFEEEIQYYRIRTNISYSGDYTQKFQETYSRVQKYYKDLVDAISTSMAFDLYPISGEVVKTLKDINEIYEEKVETLQKALLKYKNDSVVVQNEEDIKIDNIETEWKLDLIDDKADIFKAA